MSNHQSGRNTQHQQFILNNSLITSNNVINFQTITDNQPNKYYQNSIVPSQLNLVVNHHQNENDHNYVRYSNNLNDLNNHHQLQQQQQEIKYSLPCGDRNPGQNMSQTAQIVMLPTQSLAIGQAAPKHEHPPPAQQQQVPMIMPNNDGQGFQIAFPNVSVLVPTILITDKNECILIQQNSQNIGNQNISLQPQAPSQASAISNFPMNNNPGIAVTSYENVDFSKNSSHFTQESLSPGCEFLTLTNTATQTVIAGLPADNSESNELNNQNTQLISNNNCPIIGIISDPVEIIPHNEANPVNQMILAACIESTDNDNQMGNLVSPSSESANNNNNNNSTTDQYDVNTFLASTISAETMEKSDPDQAKEWLKDSFIVNRALKALKKASNRSSSHQSHNNRLQPQHQKASH